MCPETLGLYRRSDSYSPATKAVGLLIALGFVAMFALDWQIIFTDWRHAVSYSIALVMSVLMIVLLTFDLSLSPSE